MLKEDRKYFPYLGEKGEEGRPQIQLPDAKSGSTGKEQ
jgi:hypothetical protein